MTHVPSLPMRRDGPRAAGATLPARLAAGLRAAFSAWARRRRNRRALAELSPQQLADIGLVRTECGYTPLDDMPSRWSDFGRRL